MTPHACWLFLTLAATGGDAPKDYPQRHLLMEAKDLARPETAKTLLILDARTAAKYEKGHIPGASWVDHEEWSKAFGKSQDPKEWSQRIGAAGIRNTDKIVIYDDAMQKDAARVWW